MSRQAHLRPADMREHQNKRLRRLVKYAYDNVPFYKLKLKERGLKPSDIATVNDLNKLPIIRKQEIANNPAVISQEFNVPDLQVLSTSGSTGQPLKIYVSNVEDDYRKAKHLMANIFCGQKPRDRYVAITAPSHFKQVPRLLRTLSIYDRTFISVFDEIEMQISTLERIKPKILAGYASSLLLLAKELEKRERKPSSPKFILSGAELLDGLARTTIESVFGSPIFDQYAIMEFDRIAWQCPERLQYHMDAYALITEFVDQKGEPVSEGERGEIICTSLFNYAMPFIRYSVGDIGVPSDDVCACGLKLPLMKVIEGRKDSLLVLPDGRLLSPRTFTVAMNMSKLIGCIEHFRVIQKKTDYFILHIKRKDESIDKVTMKNELVKHLEKMLNLTEGELTFDIRFQDTIPLDKNGKFNAVVSEIEK
jgi:phenylacetate-CoA ligase